VIDVETDDAEEAFEQLQKIDGTIKTRILHWLTLSFLALNLKNTR
jgi:hypothetical protein